MSKLKELTWEVHSRAERSKFAKKLLSGLTPVEYHRYLLNQYEIYLVLESAARSVLAKFPNIARASKIKDDIEELEVTYQLGYDPVMICPVVSKYQMYVLTLEEDQLIAHLYVRHFGDMYGGQIIKKRNAGQGRMYDFDDVENLKQEFRELLNDSMAEEANVCFEFAIELFKELEDE